jgi:hypothetical protein
VKLIGMLIVVTMRKGVFLANMHKFAGGGDTLGCCQSGRTRGARQGIPNGMKILVEFWWVGGEFSFIKSSMSGRTNFAHMGVDVNLKIVDPPNQETCHCSSWLWRFCHLGDVWRDRRCSIRK